MTKLPFLPLMEHSRKSAISSVLLVSMEVAKRNWPSTSVKESRSKVRRWVRGSRTKDWMNTQLRIKKAGTEERPHWVEEGFKAEQQENCVRQVRLETVL